MSRRWVVLLALAAVALVPDAAHACAVCFDGPGETRQAFFATTAFLTLLPLGMLAGAGAWLRSRARRLESEDVEKKQHPES
ncbi:MAG: hypothetical protein FJ207_03875 [Gemmatimonadetes bacterium]|nr:hypothetical protein [Gemmatimonadota bacterium]